MSDNIMNIAGEMSAIAASNGIYTLADNALRLSTESLSTAIDNKVTIDNKLCNVVEQTDLSIVKLSASEYYDLVNSGSVVSNVVYVVENQFENAYGQQVKNLAPGTDLSDAVNLEQLNTVSANAGTITGITMNGASKGTSGNVDLGTVLTAHQSLANYYKKTETSSAAEVSTALDSKADADAYLPLSGGTMSGDVTLGKDNQIVFGSNSAGTIVLQDPSESDFGIHLSTEEDGQTVYQQKYIFSDTYSGFNVVEPIEEDVAVIRSGDLYAALSSKAELNDIPSQVSQLENDAGYLTAHQSLSDYYKKTETSSASEVANAMSNIKISYDSDARKIVLSAGSSTTSVDCNDFIKDGMLSTVELDGKQLVFNFNTDAGMQPISVALSNFIDETQYWKKSETSSANEISNAFQLSAGNKVFIDNHIDNATQQTDLSVIKLLADEYYQLVAESAIISNAVYVVENQFKNAYGQQIKNVALPTDLSDAATKGYVDDALTGVQIPTDLSAFTNSPGYTTNVGTITGITMNGASKGTAGNVDLGTVLTAHQSLSDYYTKSETSSAAEVSTALDNKADVSAASQVIVDGVKADISVMHMSKAEYDQTAEQGQLLSNALYIVSGDYVDVIEDIAGNKISANLCCTIAGSQNATKLATLDDITSKADTSTVTSLSNSLSSFYTKTETSSAAEISSAFQLSAGNKVFIDDRISNIAEQTDLSVIKLSSDEYGQILDDVLSNAIYIVEDSYNNAFGAQMKNLAPGTDLSDAVNVEQLSNAMSNVKIPTDLSSFTNSPGYTKNVGTITGITMNGVSKGTSGVVNLGTVLTAHQSLANYYKKTETSAAAEVNTALGRKADLTALQNYYAKSETSSANEISTALENAGGGSSRYALVTAQLVSDSGSLTCAVDDQTITTIQVSSSATPIVVQLPTQPEDGARDFILRIEISSSSAPTFTFNGVNETIDFDSEDDDWAVMEPGLNLVSFTETKRGN